MTACVKELTVLAVHGDHIKENVQRVLNEKSSRDPNIASTPEKWPQAVCDALIIAEGENGDFSRFEIGVYDFEQMAGIVQGGKIKITVEAV